MPTTLYVHRCCGGGLEIEREVRAKPLHGNAIIIVLLRRNIAYERAYNGGNNNNNNDDSVACTSADYRTGSIDDDRSPGAV